MCPNLSASEIGTEVYYNERSVLQEKKMLHSLQVQGHSKGSYDQNVTFYYIFWIADPFATKLGLMVHYHKP